MAHPNLQERGSGVALLNLDDPVDRLIAKFEFSQVDLLRKENVFAGANALERLRASGQLGHESLQQTALKLFAGITLPDFSIPFEPKVEDTSTKTDPTAGPSQLIETRQVFDSLFRDALAVLNEGTGREDLVRED